MTKPYLASEYLDQVMQVFVLSKTSMVWIIQNSSGMKENFQKFQHNSPGQLVTVQRSLGLARHRFDSTTKPAASAILTMQPLHMFAVHLFDTRRSERCGKAALAHLEYCSGLDGVERIVQFGMLTDAMDEGLLFTRFNDHEDTDTGLLMAQGTRFLNRIKVLFVDGKALETGSNCMVWQYVDMLYYI